MKLAIFGGTGKTGRLILEKALADGHAVSLLARNPENFTFQHANLIVVPGNVQDLPAVEQTVAGCEAVISLLGPTHDQMPFAVSEGTQNILRAMGRNGIRRLVIIAGAGVGDSHDNPTLVDHLIRNMIKFTARIAFNDMGKVGDLVRESDLDWTMVRVPMLIDGSPVGSIRCGYLGSGVGSRITRADLADFIYAQLESDEWLRKAPVVSN